MPTVRNYRGYDTTSQVSLLFIAFFVITFALFVPVVFATHECKDKEGTELDECLANAKSAASEDLSSARSSLNRVVDDINKYLSELSVTQSQIDQLQIDINGVYAELYKINNNLEVRRVRLQDSVSLRDSVIRAYYQSGKLSALEFFVLQTPSLNGFRLSSLVYAYDKSVTEEALNIIKRLHFEITIFEKDKAEAEGLKTELETAQQRLISLKTDIDAKRAQAEAEKAELGEEIASLEQKIADLSAKQQAILAAKGGEGVVSGYEAGEYELPDPPFSPAFAAMSYGAYTHYNGMSQYGARGRAEDGQSYEKILNHYYETDVKDEWDDDGDEEIDVEGYGEMSFQEYLYGIAEMPSSWHEEALKAQAVAARTYAYRAGKPICTSDSCQVFSICKATGEYQDGTTDENCEQKYNSSGAWRDAVDDTNGKILDDPETSQYSSTTGGYLNQSGWDADGDWPGDAYEKKGKSPWFYKAWYTQTYNDNSDKCGRSTPWLDEEEMADILNSWVVWSKGSGDERDHISPVTTSCWGGDPYSNDEMKDKADDHGDSYSSVNSVSVDIGNNGRTATVHFGTDNGSVNISGEDFKTVFNLRAPGYVSLRSRLFDIEMEN
ncbi:hypothetical protein A2886_00280 [candidate division WWE3 bacterium RIFCSPHIGHO2_01_FULL_42_13]|uniref:Sporulation stage II protein D amidase enhancer LytB N-terminal domain-containing protein n=1 Tax=candidate division WWE3 bacterium RIFCSPHIGHO2_01_FULL_42_13 TaxID=1802617 RepID=A0A1F4USN3_UNCKA|nr:MAG: hypothetical protein A2886_00280 [candidate division WWE3 bacterium RIFCSPHIGHO2_01_FULL_42_13]